VTPFAIVARALSRPARDRKGKDMPSTISAPADVGAPAAGMRESLENYRKCLSQYEKDRR